MDSTLKLKRASCILVSKEEENRMIKDMPMMLFLRGLCGVGLTVVTHHHIKRCGTSSLFGNMKMASY